MAKTAQLGHSVAEMRAIQQIRSVWFLLLQVADQLCAKYSKEYGKLCRTNQIGTVNDRVMNWWNSSSQLELAEQTCLLWLSAPFLGHQWLMPVSHAG